MAEDALKPRIRVRAAFVGAIGVSWIVLVALMWHAFRTVPSAAALSDARHVPPPLPRDFVRHTIESFLQFLLVTVFLWPWWRRFYIWRGLLATFVMMAWFLFTVPLDINNMIWLHRRWEALVILALIVAVMVASISVAVRRGSVVHAADG